MQITYVDSVDIFLAILFPPIGTLIVYGVACAAARAVSGGDLIMILGTLKMPNIVLWTSVIVWAGLVIWLAVRRRRKEKRSDGKVTTVPTP
jgi:hypothetical protein